MSDPSRLRAFILLTLWPFLAAANDAPTALERARALVDRFNAHDVAGMAALVTDDFELYYVADGASTLGARGSAQLAEQMTSYFAAHPAVRSTMVGGTDGPRFAAYREVVRWTDGEATKQQSSVAVYETRGERIARVWYFPTEAAPTPRDAASIARREAELREAESAFAAAFAAGDMATFDRFLDPGAVFLAGDEPLRGRDAIAASWSRMRGPVDQAPPFSWRPERVAVEAGGDVGLTTGPVRAPDGRWRSSYVSTWRRAADGGWRIILDVGARCPPCTENAATAERENP